MLCLCQMLSKQSRRLGQAAGLIVLLSLHSEKNCPAQTSPKSVMTIAQPAEKGNEKPFDKLELFCFFAAGPVPAYARYIIQERGTDFTPDADFISSFSLEVQRDILRAVHPKSLKKVTPYRDQAYELVRKAYQDQQHHLYPAASSEYQKALQLAPDSPTLHLAYAAQLLLAHDFPYADEQAHISLQLWPENAEAHGILALSMVLQKRSAAAETESKETLRIFPGHVSAKFALAQALTNEHKYKEAIPAIREAMVATPFMTALTKFLGIALLETGDTVGGIEQLSAYVKVSPDDAEAHYFYGVALRTKGELEQARAQFAQAARLQPKNPQYQFAANPDADISSGESPSGNGPEDASITTNEYSNRFFGFTYPIPSGCKALSPLSAHIALENLGAHLTTNDPTAQELRRLEAKLVHTLLYATAGKTGESPNSVKSVTIAAIDARFDEHATAASYADAVPRRILMTGIPGEARGAPVQLAIGGRTFWKADFVVRPTTGVRYGTAFVTAIKGYILTFTFGAPDLGTLGEIEKSLESIQFQENTKQ